MLDNGKHSYKKTIYIYILLIIFIISMIWTIYINQKNILINLRSDEMISIAKISANKLKDYFEDKVEFLDNVFQIENELLEYGLNIEKYIENKILFIKEKNEGYDGYIKYIPYELCADYDVEKYSFGECIVGPILLNEDSNYIIQIVKPIVINNEVKGIVLAEYLLDEVYEETLGKIQVGQYGYCTLKDMTGSILMHGDKNQIGLDSLNDRKKRYPKLSHKEIDRLVTNQLSGNPGSDIIKSYWWGEDEVKQVKKIIGYAPVEIGEYKWIVSAITSYNEIAIPIAKTFYFILATGIILLILIVSFIVYIIKTKNEKQKMILELKYSEEINKATSMLRKHEEKLSKTNSIHTLGMMASAIAHEFKNLLTPIFIYNEMLMNRFKDNNEIIEDLNEIKIAADNCLELSKNILFYSKDEVLENIQWFNSTEEMLSILNILKVIIPPNINLKSSINSESIYLCGNKREFKQIVLNICTNAYQSMEKNGGSIEVKYYVEDIKSVLIISDTGCGIKKEVISRIYEPFYTSKDSNGNGLGLSIVAELVKKINGNIQIESEENVGTIVKIEFNNIKSDNS